MIGSDKNPQRSFAQAVPAFHSRRVCYGPPQLVGEEFIDEHESSYDNAGSVAWFAAEAGPL